MARVGCVAWARRSAQGWSDWSEGAERAFRTHWEAIRVGRRAVFDRCVLVAASAGAAALQDRLLLDDLALGSQERIYNRA